MEDGRLGDADTNGAATDQPSPEWYATPCVMGIDEAGRGPVLGPMVYGCAICPVSEKERISKLEFADSKTLTEAKREVLFESIKADQSIAWDVDVIPASLLSAQMLSRQKRSLNAISHESAIGLIQRALNKGCILAEVFLDTVGDAEKYALRLREKFPGIEITVSKKADSLFPIVSAASIVAKVTRDHTLRDWKSDSCLETGSNFGSGYPADPETKSWLQDHLDPVFGFPSLVRFSWATCKPLLDANTADVYWDGDEDSADNPRRKSQKVEYESNAANRHPYFRARQLQQITTQL